MGMIGRVFEMLFGGGSNVIRDTAEVFVENAEKGAMRDAALRGDALAQFAGEFGAAQRGVFDRMMDAVNRLPRPAIALGTLGLFTAAMVDPIWFSSRMQGIALVPEPLWWLLGAVVSFYFGARHQLKNQQFQTQVAASLAMAPQVMRNLEALEAMRAQAEPGLPVVPAAPETANVRVEPVITARDQAVQFSDNAALQDWARQAGHRGG